MGRSMRVGIAAVVTMAAHVTFAADCSELANAHSTAADSRAITAADQLAVRRVDVLTVSPDRKRYATLVRRADPAANVYCRSWFVGSIQGGPLVYLGDGGEANLALGADNRYVGGEFDKPAARWSPDGEWLAYALTRDGEVQVWLSRADGSAQKQLTHNAADVRELEWSADGKAVYFIVGTPRAQLAAEAQARERSGYHYDSELISYTDFMLPRHEGVEPDVARSVWIVTLASGQEHPASEQERKEFERVQARGNGTDTSHRHSAAKDAMTFAARADGAQAWAARPDAKMLLFRMTALVPKLSRKPIACKAPECTGFIRDIWWRDDGTVMFMRIDGIAYSATSIYAWSPASGAVSKVLSPPDDILSNCQLAANDSLLCARENPSQPGHVVAIDLNSGAMTTIADINPEFQRIRLGKVERFEWSTPRFPWSEPGAALAGIYDERAFGYIIYPPDFVPNRKYPVFISPYAANGFDNITNQEYPLHALAAQGFVVLSTSFPQVALDIGTRVGPEYAKLTYSAELGFPHLSMYMESTLEALDIVTARGFIDERQVGIGGVSHGAFVPLYTLIKHDRFAAVAVSGGDWDPLEYYAVTKRIRSQVPPGYDFVIRPTGEGWKFWQQLSLAENVDAIEAPILFNVAAAETFSVIRLLRHMEEAGKPYDAYVFPRETHIKWQPAHLRAIMERNVDWLRFWLQSYEDPAPAKSVQYQRWRELRQMQRAKAAEAISQRQSSSTASEPR